MSVEHGDADERTATRRAELSEALARVEERIASACGSAGRRREEVTLVVVTKFFPAGDVRLLYDLGVRDIGESRAQEAVGKLADDPERDPQDLTTHFIGQLQTNKAAAVVGWADLIHTVDRPKLARAVDRAAESAGTTQSVLLQVDLDDEEGHGDPRRGGVPPYDVLDLAARVADLAHLRLAGVMAVAPREGDESVAERAFARLAAVAADVRAEHPDAVVLSAGMSGDLEAAVRLGATHLRVGSAILGSRPAVR